MFGSEAWANLLRSYAVLEGVVKEVHLDRTFTPPLPSSDAAALEVGAGVLPGVYHLTIDDSGSKYALSLGDRVEHGTVGDSIGRSFGLR